MSSHPLRNPLVSIIVPIYNGQRFIKTCIDSLLVQTYKNIEIICVVNGSSDSSLEMIQTYQLKDSRIIYLETEIGDLGRACNLGLDLAKGSYISFVDIDDWVAETYIEELLIPLKSGIKISKCNLIFYDHKENRPAYVNYPRGVYAPRNVPWLLPCRHSALYDKTLFDKHRYLEFSYYEDLASWPILLGLAGSVSYIDKPLYTYNQTNEQSIMRTATDKHLVMDKVFAYIFQNQTDEMGKELNLLITALFIQSFWFSNRKYIPDSRIGRDYLSRIKEIVKDRLVGYYYMVDRLPVSDSLKQEMIHFYRH